MKSILFVSDQHIGSTVALCKPLNELDDGGQYKASKGQRWVWRCWNNMLEWVDREKIGDLTTINDGDLTEGDFKKRSAQVITHNPANVVTLATQILEPLAEMSTALFFVRGTPAHVGPSAPLEEQVARKFDNTVYCPENGAASWWHLPLEVEGVRFSIAHEPGIGVSKNPQAKFNGINALASRAVHDYANAGLPLPHLLIRAHNHTHRDSEDNYIVRAITLPAWTLATEYIKKIDPTALATVGAVMVNVDRGKYEVKNKTFRFDDGPKFYSLERLTRGKRTNA